MQFEAIVDELRQPTRDFRRAAPDAWAGFHQLHQAAVSDGVVSGAIKELVALAIATAGHCDGCVAYHAKAAAKKGATREQVVEVLSVALLMAGGPASVWAPRALAAFDEFSQAEQAA
ncbi:MAG: carboxymuconolactone decarboxylase family protein [Nitriliruptorales bacterium]|nr:carboxymuconolactone decarboxylase family protein [Nitriliruptorales bacterium]